MFSYGMLRGLYPIALLLVEIEMFQEFARPALGWHELRHASFDGIRPTRSIAITLPNIPQPTRWKHVVDLVIAGKNDKIALLFCRLAEISAAKAIIGRRVSLTLRDAAIDINRTCMDPANPSSAKESLNRMYNAKASLDLFEEADKKSF